MIDVTPIIEDLNSMSVSKVLPIQAYRRKKEIYRSGKENLWSFI